MNVLDLWLLACEIRSPNPAFMDAAKLWGVVILTYTNEVLIRYRRYKQVVESHRRLAIGSKKMQALMRERTVAVWEQL